MLGRILWLTYISLSPISTSFFACRMRTTRDQAVIRLGLSLFRNLVAIPDTESSITGTMEQFISSIMQVTDQPPPCVFFCPEAQLAAELATHCISGRNRKSLGGTAVPVPGREHYGVTSYLGLISRRSTACRVEYNDSGSVLLHLFGNRAR